jgi:hypothetical protein
VEVMTSVQQTLGEKNLLQENPMKEMKAEVGGRTSEGVLEVG